LGTENLNKIILAHDHSSNHKEELKNSAVIGCFYCRNFIKFADIKEWIDAEDTALCPKCGIDSLIGSDSGYTVGKKFLNAMNAYWFAIK
jgi:hypothetical protein